MLRSERRLTAQRGRFGQETGGDGVSGRRRGYEGDRRPVGQRYRRKFSGNRLGVRRDGVKRTAVLEERLCRRQRDPVGQFVHEIHGYQPEEYREQDEGGNEEKCSVPSLHGWNLLPLIQVACRSCVLGAAARTLCLGAPTLARGHTSFVNSQLRCKGCTSRAGFARSEIGRCPRSPSGTTDRETKLRSRATPRNTSELPRRA